MNVCHTNLTCTLDKIIGI